MFNLRALDDLSLMSQPKSMDDDFKRMLEAFLTNAPVILPIFAVYAYEGPFLLKVLYIHYTVFSSVWFL